MTIRIVLQGAGWADLQISEKADMHVEGQPSKWIVRGTYRARTGKPFRVCRAVRKEMWTDWYFPVDGSPHLMASIETEYLEEAVDAFVEMAKRVKRGDFV